MSCAVSGYTFLSLLGRGSFGVVRKVKRDVDGKVFALKDIQITHRMSDIDRYEREVNSHRSLPKHSNILEFIDYTRDRQYMHIVLEYCELGNLEEYVLSRSIDFNTALSFMVDMSRGLNHLHSNGIVHRDIKPENVLLAPGKNDIPRCKISDFGVANMSTYQLDQIRTEFGTEEEYFSTICGTPVYLAPEVTERRYTNSCDVFSLGVVFYILFSPERTSDGRLAPWAKNGTVFYRGKDEEIQEQVKKYVTDEKVCELMYSMLRVDYHDRTTAAGVEEKLMEIALSDDEVFLVACFLIGFLLILLLLPIPLCVLCLFVFIIMAKEVFPENLINTSIVPS